MSTDHTNCDHAQLPEDHSTLELGFTASTKGGEEVPILMEFKFPKDKGLVVATALQSMMDSTIGPAFMEALAATDDQSMANFMASLGMDPRSEN